MECDGEQEEPLMGGGGGGGGKESVRRRRGRLGHNDTSCSLHVRAWICLSASPSLQAPAALRTKAATHAHTHARRSRR